MKKRNQYFFKGFLTLVVVILIGLVAVVCTKKKEDISPLLVGLLALFSQSGIGFNSDLPTGYSTTKADAVMTLAITPGVGVVSSTVSGDSNAPSIVQTIPSNATVTKSVQGITTVIPKEQKQSFEAPRASETDKMRTSIETRTTETASVPGTTPIIIYFNDTLLITSITGNIEIICVIKGVTFYVGGTVSVSAQSSGNAILSFSPMSPYPDGSSVSFTIIGGNGGIKDKGGNYFPNNIVLTFISSGSSSSVFNPSNGSFESGTNGISFTGDGAASIENGNISAPDGSNFLAISTGSAFIKSGSTAVGNTTSTVTIGPITSSFTSLSLKYNLLSEEFNEFVGTVYDDDIKIIVSGPKGSKEETITSINRSGKQSISTTAYSLYGAYTTGWKDYTLTGLSVGSPAYITLTVSDVSDTAYTSIAAFDSLVLK